MAAKLKSGGKLSNTFERVIHRRARRILKGFESENAEAFTHEARKELKKVRATLRLVRKGIGGENRRRVDRHFKAAAHLLSHARDTKVLLSTVEKLEQREHGHGAGPATRLHRLLAQGGNGHLRPQTIGMLRTHVLQGCEEDVSWQKLKWKDVSDGIWRSYEKGRDAYKTARKTASMANLHEWRKRMKDLWYQLCALKRARPRAVSCVAGELKKLSEALGDDHDLAMLQSAAHHADLDAHEKDILDRKMAASRKKLQERAFARGKKFYCDKTEKTIEKILRGHKGGRF